MFIDFIITQGCCLFVIISEKIVCQLRNSLMSLQVLDLMVDFES